MADRRSNLSGAPRSGGRLMKWCAYINRTAVRRAMWVLVGVLVYALLGWVSQAVAQERKNIEQAYAECMAREVGTWERYRTGPNICTLRPVSRQFNCSTPIEVNGNASTTSCGVTGFEDGCPVGDWRGDLNRCFDPEECLNRNDNRRSQNTVETFTTGCVDGCELAPVLPSSCSSIIGDGTTLCAARYEYSGNSCSAPPPAVPPQDDPQDRCIWFGGEAGAGGQAFCKKPDGRECYTIQGGNRAGQQICWQPGEAGKKVAGDTAQTRAPGPNEPSQPDPPPGESMEKVGDSVTTETTTTNQSGSTTTTTTTRTDRTTYGTDAGGPGARDDSEAGDGQGDSDDEGSYSGGGDCAAPPVCSGNAIQCGIALEVWNMRCEGAGEGDGDGEEGGVLADIDSAIAEGDADGDPDESEIFEHADPDTWREIRVVDAEGLDDSGFGFDRSCPQLPSVQVGPASLTFDLGPICTFLSWMSGLVLALSYFLAAKIIAGVK